MFDSIIGLDVVVVITIAILLYRNYAANRRGPLPPGPKGWPIVGNIDMPELYFWTAYAQYGQIYGDIACATILGTPIIILNSRKHVIELYEKRHQFYTERPSFTMIRDLVGWGKTTVLMPADELWRDHRRNFNRLFGTRTLMQQFHGIQVLETRRFMLNLLHSPDKLEDHIRYWAGAMILKIVYGYDIKAGHDELVEVVDEAMAQFIDLSRPGAWLVDFFPILRFLPSWFPGGQFKTFARRCRKTLDDMIELPFALVQDRMSKGVAAPSFVSKLLSADDHTPDKDYSIKTSAATIYAGGADTTSAQVHGFYLVMLLFPEAQCKAQEEIDRVVGTDRLPDFSDRENLPYTEALVKEVMRLHTAVPVNAPRRALQDDVLDGYFIPKGALIRPNVWKMLHDPEVYPNPMDFVPERWLVDSPPPQPRDYVFGFGRRICPGMIMADASFWISSVMALALFDIKATKESPTTFDHGEGGVLDGLAICHPKPFQCSITPRSSKAEGLITSVEHELL